MHQGGQEARSWPFCKNVKANPSSFLHDGLDYKTSWGSFCIVVSSENSCDLMMKNGEHYLLPEVTPKSSSTMERFWLWKGYKLVDSGKKNQNNHEKEKRCSTFPVTRTIQVKATMIHFIFFFLSARLKQLKRWITSRLARVCRIRYNSLGRRVNWDSVWEVKLDTSIKL